MEAEIIGNVFNNTVLVILNNGKEIIGKFTDDFEDEKEILVGDTILEYKDIKSIQEIKD